MRGLLLEVPESLLAERRRLGIDRWDEMWEGVLHLVPPPSGWHQEFGSELFLFLGPIAKARGLKATYETGLFGSEKSYRTPDLAFSLPSQRTERGVEGGAELVIEILSPNDETYEKLPFYAAFPVREVLVLNPDTRAIELLVLQGGTYYRVAADEKGLVRSSVLGVAFATRDGPKLEVVGPQGATASI
jgi:Uma2 family endonuclease